MPALASAPSLDEISALICRIGGLQHVPPDEDFYEAGFASLNALELLVELETAYDVQLSDDAFIAARTPLAVQQLVVASQEGAL